MKIKTHLATKAKGETSNEACLTKYISHSNDDDDIFSPKKKKLRNFALNNV